MRMLWVGKASEDGAAGDEVYDRKIISAIKARGVDVAQVSPERVSKAQEGFNLLAGGAYYRASYAAAANHRRLADASAHCDVAICSWEPFDALASRLSIPVIPILHNITSRSLPAMFPGHHVAGFLARRAGIWERRTYGSSGPFAAIAVLARADEAYVRTLRHDGGVLYAPPGLPPEMELDPHATFRPEIVISGTYDWRPKRRDVILFAQELAGLPAAPTVHAEALPDEAARLLAQKPIDQRPDAIRLGLIPDRFKAGYKLKAGYYLANNCIVLSYADVRDDFASIPDAPFFVRKIDHARDIANHLREIEAVEPEMLRKRMKAFRNACASAFSWTASADVLLNAAQRLHAMGR